MKTSDNLIVLAQQYALKNCNGTSRYNCTKTAFIDGYRQAESEMYSRDEVEELIRTSCMASEWKGNADGYYLGGNRDFHKSFDINLFIIDNLKK